MEQSPVKNQSNGSHTRWNSNKKDSSSVSPEKGKSDLLEKGRAGRTAQQHTNDKDDNVFTKSTVGLPFEIEEQNNMIVLAGMNYDCEEGGEMPEEFDDEMRPDGSSEDDEEALMDEGVDYGCESEEGESSDAPSPHKRYPVKKNK